jgi:hypothetical protein
MQAGRAGGRAVTLFPQLETLDQVQARRAGKPIEKGESRLQKTAREQKDETKQERAWFKAIDKRDKGVCRWCARKTVATIKRVPERREHHHVSGRVVEAIRWDKRNGITLCCACHERVTGKVNERFVIESKHTFTVDAVQYLNADKRVKFTRVA